MKRNMIIGAVLFVISLTSSVAQEVAVVNSSISASFDRKFAGATQLKWTECGKDVSLARFKYMEKTWLAYFDAEGKVISSGHKVTADELPARVTESMQASKQKHEKKYGALTVGIIYQMVTDREREYYIPFVNDKISLLVAVSPNGGVTLKHKANGTGEQRTPSVIARTN